MRFRVKVSPPDPLTQTRVGVIWSQTDPDPIGWFAMNAIDYIHESLFVGNLIREKVLGGASGEIRVLIKNDEDTIPEGSEG